MRDTTSPATNQASGGSPHQKAAGEQNAAQALVEFFGAAICIYSRAQAIADGVLVDISSTAREAGLAWPVAMTQAAWADCVAWTSRGSPRFQCNK